LNTKKRNLLSSNTDYTSLYYVTACLVD